MKRSRRPPLRALASTVLRSSVVNENSAATKTRVARDEQRRWPAALSSGDGDVHRRSADREGQARAESAVAHARNAAGGFVGTAGARAVLTCPCGTSIPSSMASDRRIRIAPMSNRRCPRDTPVRTRCRPSPARAAADGPRRSPPPTAPRPPPARAARARVDGADVGAGAAHARGDVVEQVLDAAAGRVQPHPRRRDAFLEQRLAGPIERAVARRCGRPPPAWTPCRSSPCTAGRRGRASGRRATRRCRRTTTRSSRWTPRRPAPAPRPADAGCRRRPTRGHPSCFAAEAHSRTAENCGRPTPVIIRVVHIAPGPTPTLTMVAPALEQIAGALRRHHVAGRQRHTQVQRRDRLDRVQRLDLMSVRGVDDQQVDAGLGQRPGLGGRRRR